MGSKKLYVSIQMGEYARAAKTRIIKNERLNPVWNESFHIYCAHNVSEILVMLKEAKPVGAEVIGQTKVPVSDILSGQEIDRSYELFEPNDNPLNNGLARIHIRMQYFDISTDPFYGRGCVDHKYPGVPYTFFKQYSGCKLTLYQDSHVPDTFDPKIYLSNGKLHEFHRCWEDIYKAISGAKHLIYVTGWSIYTKIELVRDPNRPIEGAQGLTLGQLLKNKASEGVRVNILVWDDRTSVGFIKKNGIMGTHDEDTEEYFKGSDVNCVLCGRNPDNGLSVVQEIEISTMFTHHQKTVVVDAPLPGKAYTHKFLHQAICRMQLNEIGG